MHQTDMNNEALQPDQLRPHSLPPLGQAYLTIGPPLEPSMPTMLNGI